MALHISSVLLERIVAHARAAAPAECCGLLLGDPGQAVVRQLRPARNLSPDPLRRFELDPAMLLAAHRAARAGGPAILGHYHSHPRGPAEPSATDARNAASDGSFWLIVGAHGQITAWRASATGHHLGRFDRWEIRPDDENPAVCALASAGGISA